MTVYGPMIDVGQVEDKVEAVIRKWIDTYLGQIERENDLQLRSILRPHSYRIDMDVRKLPEEQTPALVVVSAGMTEQPSLEEDGRIDAIVLMGAACIVKGKVRTEGNRTARRYGAAVATLIEQQAADLAPIAQLGSTAAESYEELPTVVGSALAVGYVTFALVVAGMRNRFAGPEQPDPGPPTPLPPESPGGDALHTSTNVTVDEE